MSNREFITLKWMDTDTFREEREAIIQFREKIHAPDSAKSVHLEIAEILEIFDTPILIAHEKQLKIEMAYYFRNDRITENDENEVLGSSSRR